jgi:hypothetical protein
MQLLVERTAAPALLGSGLSDLMNAMGYTSVTSFLEAVGQSRDLKAEAIAAALYALTGERPVVTHLQDATGSYSQVALSDRQNTILLAMVNDWIAKAPGDVRVDLSGVWLPLLLKRGWPYMLGAAAAGAVGKALI